MKLCKAQISPVGPLFKATSLPSIVPTARSPRRLTTLSGVNAALVTNVVGELTNSSHRAWSLRT